MRIAIGVISGILFGTVLKLYVTPHRFSLRSHHFLHPQSIALFAGCIVYSFTAIYGIDIPTFRSEEDGNWQLGILIALFGSLVNKVWLFAAWAGILW